MRKADHEKANHISKVFIIGERASATLLYFHGWETEEMRKASREKANDKNRKTPKMSRASRTQNPGGTRWASSPQDHGLEKY